MNSAIAPSDNHDAHMQNESVDLDDSQISCSVLDSGQTQITYAKKGYGVLKTTRPLGAVRLELAMHNAGITQTQLAAICGVTQTTISRIIKGETLNSKHLPKIAEALKKNANWLAGFDQPEKNTVTISGNKLVIENSLFIVVPQYRAHKDGESGHIIGRETDQENTRMMLSSSIPDSVNKDDLRFFVENERAMRPIINAGATVFFENRFSSISSGDIYAVIIGGQISARYLFIQPNGDILMRAKESDFPDFTISQNQVRDYVKGPVLFVINKLS